MTLDTLVSQFESLWQQAVAIWIAGGWCMPPIAITALALFALGMDVFLKLRETGYQSVPEKTWREWINHPERRKGPVGELLNFVTGGQTLQDTAAFFEELRIAEIAPFERNLKIMKICVGAAPLLGLLGTVTGMLVTFNALATGSGGEKTMAMIAAGISEALITTETGLIIALPGLFFQYQLIRKYDRYKTFLAHLETVCTQNLYKRLHGQANGNQ